MYLVSPSHLPTSASVTWPCVGLFFCNDCKQPLLTLSLHNLVRQYIDLTCSQSEKKTKQNCILLSKVHSRSYNGKINHLYSEGHFEPAGLTLYILINQYERGPFFHQNVDNFSRLAIPVHVHVFLQCILQFNIIQIFRYTELLLPLQVQLTFLWEHPSLMRKIKLRDNSHISH